MALTLSGPPIDDSLIQLNEQEAARRDPFYMALAWIRWLLDVLVPAIQAAPQIKRTVSLVTQSAAIGATAIPLGALAAGTYRIGYYARVTSPDGVSSSLTVTLGWTESAQPLTLSGAAMTGDSLTTVQTGLAVVIIDAASALTYATVYASNTPAKMQYRLTLVVEQIG